MQRYSTHLLQFLMRPNENLARELTKTKELIGWSSLERPLLSLHVRKGDSCSAEQQKRKSRKCDSLDVYMDEAVLPMAKK